MNAATYDFDLPEDANSERLLTWVRLVKIGEHMVIKTAEFHLPLWKAKRLQQNLSNFHHTRSVKISRVPA